MILSVSVHLSGILVAISLTRLNLRLLRLFQKGSFLLLLCSIVKEDSGVLHVAVELMEDLIVLRLAVEVHQVNCRHLPQEAEGKHLIVLALVLLLHCLIRIHICNHSVHHLGHRLSEGRL